MTGDPKNGYSYARMNIAHFDDLYVGLYPLAMHKLLLAPILVLTAVPTFAGQKPLQADQVLAAAKSQAAKENTDIFLIFGASWCEGCHQLDAFLADSQIHQIFDKYFMITRITVAEENGGNPALNNPGGLNLLAKFGGVGPGGVAGLPFIAILNAKGRLITNSNLPTRDHSINGGIGYPAKPQEIDWFITMLQKASPAFNTEDAQAVRDWLTKQSRTDTTDHLD